MKKLSDKMKKRPDAILSADEHFREDTPICRTDDYWQAQKDKLEFLRRLQRELQCPVISAGDLLNKSRVSPFLERFLIQNLPDVFITIPGNHDIPNHNMGLYEKSSLSVLEASGKAIIITNYFPRDEYSFTLYGSPYGFEYPLDELNKKYNMQFDQGKHALLHHTMTWKGREPYPGAAREGCGATALLKKYPDFDLIVTGHNHQSFVVEYEGRLLVNPGSMMRMTADQIDHRPCVYLWYAETNTVEPIYYPIEKGVVSIGHISEVKERDERIGAFVSRLKTDTELGLSFEKNLEGFIAKNDIHKDTEKIIWEVLE